MVFSSLLFLFRFLPAVLLLYYAVPRRLRNGVLLLVSLIFYAWGEPRYVVLMIASILITWTGGYLVSVFGRAGRKKSAKAALLLSVGAALALLGYFKYADFAVRTVNDVLRTSFTLPGLALPIGISFYTFQSISYIIDVYRGNVGVQKNLISYGAYVTMFPQLIAGPIVQYKTIDRQLRKRRETPEQFAEGINRFIIGLGKKVLLANNAGALWDYIRVLPAQRIPVLTAWLGLAAFTFQIYFDFSAYSDMAIGLGRMFGFRFLENFRYPYLSSSVTEFWRRWHISLGTWFREYVYIPLGGNRVAVGRFILNTMIVWLLTGFWHGAAWNFVLWGVYYGVLLLIEKLFLGNVMEKIPSWVRHVYCMLLVMIGWYIFSYGDIASGNGYLQAMLGLAGNGFAGGETRYLLYNHLVLFIFLIVGATDLPARIARALLKMLSERDTVCIVIRGIFYAAVFLLSVAYLVDASYNPFLYFRF